MTVLLLNGFLTLMWSQILGVFTAFLHIDFGKTVLRHGLKCFSGS